MSVTETDGNELLRRPIWQAKDLGLPIPASTHAVSVALPRWEDVVGYEEKRPEVVQRLATGYPRFVIHPLSSKTWDRTLASANSVCLFRPIV